MFLARAWLVGLTRPILGIIGLAAIAFAAKPFAAKPGFGLFHKKSIELRVRQPAVVRLANTSVAFTGSSTNPEYVPVQGSLLATLETELISNEKTLVKKSRPAEAAWAVNVAVTGFSVAPPKQRTESGSNYSTTYVRWQGSLDIAYQVVDQEGHTHDAGNVDSRYDKEFTANGTAASALQIFQKKPVGARSSGKEIIPNSPEDVKQILVKDIVSQVASKLGTTARVQDAQIATGEEHLDRSAEFMERGLWARALDELQKGTALPKPEDEAYHQYDLGLTYEAMSYDSKTSSEQRENIFKAAEYYDKALELNPKEKYFVDTVARTRDAIARYKALDTMRADDAKRVSTVAPKAPAAPEPPPVKVSTPETSATSAKPVTVGDVVEMRSAGVGDEQIAEYIRNSSVQFNPFDKDTIIIISRSKLPVGLQNELRTKVGAPRLAAGRAPAGHVPPGKALVSKPQ